jgi:AcrR family transcriptional regulator
MAEQDRERRTRRRLDSSARRGEILAAAADVIAAHGFLPIPVEQVASGAGVSKGLVYAYFPTRTALYDAVLAQAIAALAPGIDALAPDDFEALAVVCAELYFDHVARHGTLLHVLFTDPVLDGHRGAPAVAWRNGLWRRLIRASRAYARLAPREAVGALAIILSLPEETGRLAHRGEMEVERGRGLCAELVLSALRGLRSAAAAG